MFRLGHEPAVRRYSRQQRVIDLLCPPLWKEPHPGSRTEHDGGGALSLDGYQTFGKLHERQDRLACRLRSPIECRDPWLHFHVASRLGTDHWHPAIGARLPRVNVDARAGGACIEYYCPAARAHQRSEQQQPKGEQHIACDGKLYGSGHVAKSRDLGVNEGP